MSTAMQIPPANAAQPQQEPKLLKKRQIHSRWIVVLVVLGLLVVETQGGRNLLYYQTMRTLGIVFIAVCIAGRGYCSAFIGGVKNDMLMRDGPFSVVRNPLYVFSFIGVTGIGMLSAMWSLTLFFMVAFAVYYKFVVAREEAFLLAKFGEPYQKYLHEVPRWWPKWKLWHEPEQITIRPKFLRRTLLDAMAFLLPLPFFVTLNMLHLLAILPVWLWLP